MILHKEEIREKCVKDLIGRAWQLERFMQEPELDRQKLMAFASDLHDRLRKFEMGEWNFVATPINQLIEDGFKFNKDDVYMIAFNDFYSWEYIFVKEVKDNSIDVVFIDRIKDKNVELNLERFSVFV